MARFWDVELTRIWRVFITPDCGYVAAVPELAGCSAFGETEEAALREVGAAMELWLETAENLRREIPQPGGRGGITSDC
ncbi:MAG: hypothetical protein C5S47_03625 [Candidatus Methanogasteraceae archaeon]|nr:MAG: hypothetical protein C5S47_03625 [ANME-2 cluster archaeon]